MKIGIIGAGNIGAMLARKLPASGHEVKLANSRGPDTIRDLARDVGAIAVSKEEAVQRVAVIVLSIHLRASECSYAAPSISDRRAPYDRHRDSWYRLSRS